MDCWGDHVKLLEHRGRQTDRQTDRQLALVQATSPETDSRVGHTEKSQALMEGV